MFLLKVKTCFFYLNEMKKKTINKKIIKELKKMTYGKIISKNILISYFK